MKRNILVINAGSSSVKYQLIDMKTESVSAKGICERIGLEGSLLKHSASGKEFKKEIPMPTHNEAIAAILAALTDGEYGCIDSLEEISAIGHRIVHGGEDFTSSVVIDDNVLKMIEKNADLAPLHNPPNIMGIKAAQKAMPKVSNVAVFDTTFHTTMPKYAYMYGIKYEDYEKYKIRKYGFHGTSHFFVSSEATRLTNGEAKKIVSCHLGNGASIAAVEDGKCVDTSMGLTPLEGLIMGTRCGDIDPALLEFHMRKTGFDIENMTAYLNKQCGVFGISGISSDFRDLLAAADGGHERARLALEMFCYRVLKYVGSYAAAMNGLDCLVFTGGIGENTELVREWVCERLGYLGVKINKELNNNIKRGEIVDLTGENSRVKVYIIPTNEELVIARETARLVK